MAKTIKNAPKTARKAKKVQTPIKIANYQKLAMKTCLPQCKCWAYAIPELISEVCEFFAKHYGFFAKRERGDMGSCPKERFANHIMALKEIKKELGDIAWSLALLCEIEKISFLNKINCAKKQKKSLSDSCPTKLALYIDINASLREMVSDRIKRISFIDSGFACFFHYCKEYRFKVSDVLRENIRKLASRQKRGVIKGNGDNR